MATNEFLKILREQFDACKSVITLLEERNDIAQHLEFALRAGFIDHSQFDYLKSALNDSYETHYWQLKKEVR